MKKNLSPKHKQNNKKIPQTNETNIKKPKKPQASEPTKRKNQQPINKEMREFDLLLYNTRKNVLKDNNS